MEIHPSFFETTSRYGPSSIEDRRKGRFSCRLVFPPHFKIPPRSRQAASLLLSLRHKGIVAPLFFRRHYGAQRSCVCAWRARFRERHSREFSKIISACWSVLCGLNYIVVCRESFVVLSYSQHFSLISVFRLSISIWFPARSFVDTVPVSKRPRRAGGKLIVTFFSVVVGSSDGDTGLVKKKIPRAREIQPTLH